jgi:antirestriction protein ArdC
MLRYYSVFNVEQCDGIEYPKPDVPTFEFTPIERAEQIVAGMPNKPEITSGGDSAYYRPSLDQVNMPPKERFERPEYFYDTLFHELTHATGHESRLNRKGVADKDEHSQFGSDPYAREELVAEMGASFLCGHAGIVERTIDNSAAYIGHWLEQLKQDPRLVIVAAGQAQKAADYILGTQPEQPTEE